LFLSGQPADRYRNVKSTFAMEVNYIQTGGDQHMKFSTPTKAASLALALTAFWTAAGPLDAEAALQGTSGNALVRNTVSVAYSDAHGTAQSAVTAKVDVTVNTVAVAPTIFNFDASGTTDGTGATQLYHAWVRTNSNGPGTVSLAGVDSAVTNITVSGTVPTAISSVYLGSTIFDPNGNGGIIGTAQTIASNATITIAVPNDQQVTNDAGSGAGATGANQAVNALAVNDTVYITDGTTYYGPLTVTATQNNAVGAGATAATSSLTLKNTSGAALPTFTPQAGWQIVEAKQFTFTVTQGVVTTPTTAASWLTTVTGTMGAQNGTGTVTTNAKEGQITVTKYVRNVTNPVVGANPLPVTFNTLGTITYYQSGVNGKPTDVLEYLLVINDSGLGGASAVIASDAVATYSTLLTWSSYATGSGTVFAHAKLGATESDLATGGTGLNTVGFGGSTGTAAGSTMTFDLGNGSAWGTGGALTNTQTEYVIYQVKIN